MEDKNNTNNHTDDDILECKADILRASDEAPIEIDDDDINIFEDDDLDGSSFEITLEDSEVDGEDGDEVKTKPEHVVPKLDLSKRILVNERRAAAGRRQKAGGNNEKKTPAAAEPKNVIPEATGSMGALLNEAKRKRGGTADQSERKFSEKPIVATKKKIPIVELPNRTIKDVKITSRTVIKQPAVQEEVNDLQRRIISEIVARDLASFCG
ncbi:MAG: hypothetical protein KAJ07_10760 [Planctomycetes bacterium]|nr:hypothetical protein [Planctomycetota bacterium]